MALLLKGFGGFPPRPASGGAHRKPLPKRGPQPFWRARLLEGARRLRSDWREAVWFGATRPRAAKTQNVQESPRAPRGEGTRDLAASKARAAPELLQASLRVAWAARWWALLSVAAQEALAPSLVEPSLQLLGGWDAAEPSLDDLLLDAGV